jgi:NAD-dependent DNA ligase
MRIKDRAVDELIGLCRGILADGSIVAPEAVFLRDWLAGHAHLMHEYPFNVIASRVCDALGDDVLEADEERDLIELCLQITGNPEVLHPVAAASKASTCLPFLDPPPEIMFDGTCFLISGIFSFGTRKDVTREIVMRGGTVRDAIANSVDLLVVGSLQSTAWAHSTHGRKIEEAVKRGIPIVSETHWASFL